MAPDTRVTPSEPGHFHSFPAAKAAAIEHLEDLLAGGEETLRSLRRAASFEEYAWASDERSPKCPGPLLQGIRWPPKDVKDVGEMGAKEVVAWLTDLKKREDQLDEVLGGGVVCTGAVT